MEKIKRIVLENRRIPSRDVSKEVDVRDKI